MRSGGGTAARHGGGDAVEQSWPDTRRSGERAEKKVRGNEREPAAQLRAVTFFSVPRKWGSGGGRPSCAAHPHQVYPAGPWSAGALIRW